MKYSTPATILVQSLAMMLVSVGSSASAQNSVDKPNIIFFAFDDLNDFINPMGYSQAKTPNLDRLAKMGVTFTNAHTTATYCAPARTAIMTGRYATTTGAYETQVYFHDHPDLVPMQMSFQNAGYSTHGGGKLFHHREGFIDRRRWDEFFMRSDRQKQEGWPLDSWGDGTPVPGEFPVSTYNKKRTAEGTMKGKTTFLEIGAIPDDQEEAMADTKRINWACSILKKKHDKPFFLGVGIYAPHFPNFAPQKYFDLYEESELNMPEYKEGDLEDLAKMVRQRMINRKKLHHDRLEKWGLLKESLHAYLACVSYGDAMLGRVLDTLEASDYRENTAIVVWSDHGYHQGQKGEWGKHSLWERTTHVPFIWAGPGIAKNKKVNATVSLLDMFPTFVEMCGLAPDPGLEGQSLVLTLKNPTSAKDRDVFVPWLHPNSYAVINEKWRYIHFKDGSQELYNLQEDPNEWHNLAGSAEHVDVMKKLRASAPKNPAKPGTDKVQLRLVIDGTDYRWEGKKKARRNSEN
ncbi:MAG: sulfatase [Akkermansiaceae bacterium]